MLSDIAQERLCRAYAAVANGADDEELGDLQTIAVGWADVGCSDEERAEYLGVAGYIRDYRAARKER